MNKKVSTGVVLIFIVLAIYFVYTYFTMFKQSYKAIDVDGQNTTLIPIGKYYFNIQKFKLFDGTFIIKNENGSIKKDTIKNGLRNGLRTIYYKDGNIEANLIYKNDLLNGPIIGWYQNGNILLKATYVNGKLDGQYQKWYQNGNIKIKSNFLKGKLNGEYKEWNNNGEMIEKSFYKLGTKTIQSNRKNK